MYRDKTVPSPVPPLSRLVGFRFPLIAWLGLVLALWLLLVGAALALTPRMAPAAAPLSQTPAAQEVEMAFAVSWSGPISLTASGTYWDVAVGDVNHDGRLDAVATVFLNGGIKGWLGNGTGGWTAMSGLPTTGSYRGVKLADLDVDGQLDVVAASVGNGVRIWRGNGAGGWTAWTGPATSGSYSDVDVGDWNNDSIPDLAATKIANGGITAWRGNGAGTWTLGAANLPSTLTGRTWPSTT